jgi:iron complex transport system ATP-binding protein
MPAPVARASEEIIMQTATAGTGLLLHLANAHLAERSMDTLSGGERQRIHLARALAQVWDAESGHCALLLDEPANALDVAHQHATLAVARRFASRGTAVLAVLHDLDLAFQYADRCVVLADGRIAHEGPPDTLASDTVARVLGARITRCDGAFGSALVLRPAQTTSTRGDRHGA